MARARLTVCLALALVVGALFGCNGAGQSESAFPASGGSSAASGQAITDDDIRSMTGTWIVGGIYYRGSLIDVHDEEALEDLYDSTMLTLNDDGSFVYLRLFGDRGSWSRKSIDNDEQFILKSESSFKLSMSKGSFVEEEVESSKKSYLLDRLDENTASFVEYDESKGEAVGDKDPLVFVKQGSESAYIAQHKTPLSTNAATKESATSKSSAADDSGKKSSAVSSAGSSKQAKSDDDEDFEIVESGYDDANGKGYKGSDGNYYFQDNDGSVMATDGKGNGVKDIDGDGEADYYTTDSGQTWHEL